MIKEKESIRLLFSFNRDLIHFVILKREVFYTDKVFENWIRVLPKDERVTKQILMSRNKVPRQLIKMFKFSEKEMEEYNNAKDDEAISNIIIKDAQLKGCKLEKKWIQ